MKSYNVIALGELLVDFVQAGTSEQGTPLFEANPGGAPCNVLAMLNRLGHDTAFIGMVGDDSFGHMLKHAIELNGIDARYLCMSGDTPTTLAFVHKTADGDRAFSFYRNPGADMMLHSRDVPEEVFACTQIFHFGSLLMTSAQSYQATAKAIDLAERYGVLRSFDPNLRESLWADLADAKEKIRYGLAHCDVLKIADNELIWLTGTDDFDQGIRAIRSEFDIPLILLTLGKSGSRAYYQGLTVHADGFPTKDTIDTTGAGDTFFACVLSGVLQHGLAGLNEQTLYHCLRFANAAASLITTRKGALAVMPSRAEIIAWQEAHL